MQTSIATCNGQHCSMQRAALQHAATTKRNGNSACNGQHCNVQQAENDSMQRSALQHAKKTTFQLPDATDSKIGCSRMRCNMQRAALHHAETTRFKLRDATDSKIGCNGQHCNMHQAEPTTCNVATRCLILQHATLQHVASACNMQRCNMLPQPATRSVAPTCSMQHAQRAACNGHHAQRAALQRTALQRAQQLSCNKPLATCNIKNHATDRIATWNGNMQRTAVVPWYRACEAPARARVGRAAARTGEGHFNAILIGSAAVFKEGFPRGMG